MRKDTRSTRAIVSNNIAFLTKMKIVEFKTWSVPRNFKISRRIAEPHGADPWFWPQKSLILMPVGFFSGPD